MDGIEALEKDHDRIRSLFGELESNTEPEKLQDSFEKLGNILTIHAEAEEQVLYPQASSYEGTAEWIDKGRQEHDKSDELVLALKSINPKESEFKQKIGELQTFMLSHLDDEEKQLFPKVRQYMSDRKLEELGKEIRETKAEVAPKVVD